MNIIIINGVTLETILEILVAWAKAILLHAIAVIVIIAVIALVLDYFRLKSKSNQLIRRDRMWCYRLELDIKLSNGEVTRNAKMNIVATNFDAAMQKLNALSDKQNIEILKLECIDEFSVLIA